MMNTSSWKEFRLIDYFDIVSGKYHYPDEYNEGETPYVSASNENNGVGQYINLPPDFEGNCIVTGKVGCTAFYQPEPFCATSDVNIFKPKFNMTPTVGLFIVTIINFNENYKWTYGRQCRVGDSKKITIKLPAAPSGQPDWEYMEDFMGGLHCKPITTSVKSSHVPLETEKWKKFYLKDICEISMGNKMDFSKMNNDNPSVGFIGRSGDNNGLAGMVDEIEDVIPYPAGDVTVALGGSISTTSVQDKPFYTSQNVAVLHFDNKVSIPSKLFIATLIMNECKYKYVAFGRELNTHIRTDFELYIPTTPSDKPDWQWMEDYIKSLPYSDRIKKIS